MRRSIRAYTSGRSRMRRLTALSDSWKKGLARTLRVAL